MTHVPSFVLRHADSVLFLSWDGRMDFDRPQVVGVGDTLSLSICDVLAVGGGPNGKSGISSKSNISNTNKLLALVYVY